MQVGAGSGVIRARSDCVCCLTSCHWVSPLARVCDQLMARIRGEARDLTPLWCWHPQVSQGVIDELVGSLLLAPRIFA